jgi:hypothetical protein
MWLHVNLRKIITCWSIGRKMFRKYCTQLLQLYPAIVMGGPVLCVNQERATLISDMKIRMRMVVVRSNW